VTADPAEAFALAAVRREVGRRAAQGTDDASMPAEWVAARLEDDPAARRALEMAAVEAVPPEGPGPPPGPRTDRERRRAAAHRAIDALVLAGELAPDGPGRVRLPGFGASTWRAIAALRRGAGGAQGRWARALAWEPLGDLGDAAPPALAGPPPDPVLSAAAMTIHAMEARRQDLRDLLLRADASAGASRDAGQGRAVEILRDECREIDALIRSLDERIASAWGAGLALAARAGHAG
jgi:hypothetical protein